MDRGSQLSQDDEDDKDDKDDKEDEEEEERRTRQEEAEEEEEATDIKSNNPHLAGGEKSLHNTCALLLKLFRDIMGYITNNVENYGERKYFISLGVLMTV